MSSFTALSVQKFLTVGDWEARVWAEELEGPLLVLGGYTERLTGGCWSPTRPSLLLLARQDGRLDLWDILYQQARPTLSCKVWPRSN